MIISDKYKIIFLRNPKCASSSIRDVLFDFDSSFIYDSKLYYNKISEHLELDKWSHVPAREVFRGMGIIQHDISQYFIFGTIRNPWEKLVSYFTYSKIDNNGKCFFEKDYNPYKGMCSFEKYIEDNLFLKTDIEKWFGYKKQIIQNIYKIENFSINKLEADYEIFTGVEIKLPSMIHINKTNHKQYREYYNDKTKKIIEIYYKKDIEYGNYIF